MTALGSWAAVLAVFGFLALVAAAAGYGWDRVTYWRTDRAERRAALARSKRYRRSTRAGAR